MARKISISVPDYVYEILERRAKQRGMHANEYVKAIIMTLAEIEAARECQGKLERLKDRLHRLLGPVG